MARAISLHKTSQRGLRPSNEDVERFNINLDIDGSSKDNRYAPIDFCVICDGHGGEMVAQYVAPELEYQMMKPNLIYPLSINHIIKMYSAIQEQLKKHPSGLAKYCGCTALVVIRYLDDENQESIQVINSGDCRAVLSRNGLAIPLSKDHKPYWSDEKKRIDLVNKKYPTMQRQIHYESGDWRIGDLSVSRSFGDLDNTPHVTHIPDAFHYQLQSDDEFIIMACDGLWDVVQNHEAVNFVRDHLYNNNTELYNMTYTINKITRIYPSTEVKETNVIARKLASYAIAKGSNDNVSVIIWFFKK